MNVIESTKNITLHAKNNLNITSNEITINSVYTNETRQDCKGNFTIAHTEYQEDIDFFIIHLNEPLHPKCQYEAFIPFRSNLSTGLLGYYRSTYTDKATKEKR